MGPLISKKSRLVKHYSLARTHLRALELGPRALNETFKDQEAS